MGKLIEQFCKVVYMANKYMKMCWTSLALKKMQVKMTMRLHLIPVRTAIIKTTNSKCWQGFENGKGWGAGSVGGNIN
jgi:hypothetical protein